MKTITKHYIDGALVESRGREGHGQHQRHAWRSAGTLGRIQVLGRPRIRYIRDRGVSRTTGHSRVTAFAWPNESNKVTSS
jgi:hypothetical protein